MTENLEGSDNFKLEFELFYCLLVAHTKWLSDEVKAQIFKHACCQLSRGNHIKRFARKWRTALLE